MNQSHSRWVVLASMLMVVSFVVSVLLRAAPSPVVSLRLTAQRGTPGRQPKITWSTTSVETVLSPGGSTTKDLNFASDQDLQSVVIEPVPALVPFLALQPNAFTNVSANQPQVVRLDFRIPTTAAVGNYDGTIHARIGNQTLPQTLKVVLTIAPKVAPADLLTGVVPQENQVFSPGDTIQITLTPRTGISLIAVVVNSLIGSDSRQSPDPITPIRLQIPLRISGPLSFNIVAVSADYSWAEIVRNVLVVPQANLQRINVDPMGLSLVAPGSSTLYNTNGSLTIAGHYADGYDRDITQLPQTTISSDNPAVATVDSQGTVTAVAPGITTVRVSNSGVFATTMVKVNIFERRGELDGDGDIDQDDINIIIKALNTNATGTGDPRDLNNDGKIDALDIQIISDLCSRPGCATQ